MRPYRLIPIIALAGLASAAIGFGCVSTDCEFATCPPATSSGGLDATDDSVQPPAGCDPKIDAKDAPNCVSNDFAVFVDARGDDANAGTKEAPVKTIKAALEKRNGKPRIYICEGSYDEHVKVTSSTSLIGGFSCGAWVYANTRAKFAPTTPGFALHVTDVPKAPERPVISDLEFTALAGSAPSESSIAAFINAAEVTVRRVRLAAGAGVSGVAGSKGVTATPTPANLNGEPGADAPGGAGGATKKCTCSAGGYSEGGKGGDLFGEVNGKDGTVIPTVIEPAGNDGKGGTQSSCQDTGTGGRAGSNGTKGESATSPSRALTANGWEPGNGASGADGKPGQGGGGGGGKSTNPGPGGGGGGACGGCQGTGGGGGGAGGSSIALVVLDATVALENGELVASDAGDGKDGAVGGDGQFGGLGGIRVGGCSGGNGGTGGPGGAGAGGAGGISAGILWKGIEPTVDDTTKAATVTGRAGIGGNGGIPKQNDGPPGIADKIVAL